jgi:hypothetical protein
LKSTKGAVAPYRPGPPPANLPPEAQRYLDEELNRVAGVLAALMAWTTASTARLLTNEGGEPADPYTPMLAYADGITWDPGSGEGYYYYNSHGEWTPLG